MSNNESVLSEHTGIEGENNQRTKNTVLDGPEEEAWEPHGSPAAGGLQLYAKRSAEWWTAGTPEEYKCGRSGGVLVPTRPDC